MAPVSGWRGRDSDVWHAKLDHFSVAWERRRESERAQQLRGVHCRPQTGEMAADDERRGGLLGLRVRPAHHEAHHVHCSFLLRDSQEFEKFM